RAPRLAPTPGRRGSPTRTPPRWQEARAGPADRGAPASEELSPLVRPHRHAIARGRPDAGNLEIHAIECRHRARNPGDLLVDDAATGIEGLREELHPAHRLTVGVSEIATQADVLAVALGGRLPGEGEPAFGVRRERRHRRRRREIGAGTTRE